MLLMIARNTLTLERYQTFSLLHQPPNRQLYLVKHGILHKSEGTLFGACGLYHEFTHINNDSSVTDHNDLSNL